MNAAPLWRGGDIIAAASHGTHGWHPACELPARVYRLDLATGRRELWREWVPYNPAGVYFIRPPHFSSDGKSYAYSYRRTLSELFLADGLK